MRPITRRHALQLTAVGLLTTATGGVGLWRAAGGTRAAVGAALVEPPVLASEGGGLDVTLRAARGTVDVAGQRAQTLSYNGGLPGPTVRVAAGDRLRVRLVNDLDEPTNLHVHGLHVSPRGHSDNVFVAVRPGETFDYRYDLPGDHPPGVYWYHPHHHGAVADQVFGGLYGAIVVEDRAAEIPADRERVLVVSDISLVGGAVASPSRIERMAGREGDLVLVNGQRRPVLTTREGARERWRVVNACSSRYLRLRLPGHEMRLLGIDSGRFADPELVSTVTLAPGNRADLLVDPGADATELVTDAVDRGGPGGMMGAGARSVGNGNGSTVLADVEVSGSAAGPPPPLPSLAPVRDLRGATVSRHRRLSLGMGMGAGMGRGPGGGMDFTFDGRTFDPDRVDQATAIGDVEEWTLVNTTPMDHPVHLHVWPMQVLDRDGGTAGPPRWQDVVNVPAGGEVAVRVAFDDYPGRSVYHCHILDHEDLGMMGTVEAR